MIVGSGDIGTVLKEVDRDDVLFFASGVSNSRRLKESEYDREQDLLLDQDLNKHIVYFSSLSVFYSQSRYAKHKLKMERLIKNRFSKYTIVRIGNITWGKNPNTLINFIKGKLFREERLTVKNVYRYLIDKEEFLHWMGMIPTWSAELNITGRRIKVKQIVEEIKKGLI